MPIIKREKTDKRRKPRKPALSPSKISTYLACRAMYKYTYINRIGRFFYKPKAYHAFGASLHRTLEDFHKSGGAEAQSPEDMVQKLHNVWTSMGYASQSEEDARFADAAQYLQNYHTEHLAMEAQTILTEKQLKVDMGDFNLIGRLDRLDEHKDGHLEIIDYKSGRLSVTEEEIRDDLAMGIYSYLTHKNYPGKLITATIYCLRTGSKATVEFTEDDLLEVEDGVMAIASDLLQVDEDSVIDPEWLPFVCPDCDYLKLCARRMDWDIPKLIEERDYS